MPANGKVTIKYKADAETSFTTIKSNSTNNDIRTSAVNADTNDDGTPDVELPTYKEITFRIELTAQTAATTGDIGAITGLRWKSEIIRDDIYD